MAYRKHILSKSSFLKGVQCRKALYLGKYHSGLKDSLSDEQLQSFRKGHRVGKLAWQLFPGGVDMTPEYKFDYHQALKNTSSHLAGQEAVLYEAAFQYRQVLVLADVVVQTEDGLKVYEVKSSSRIKETHLLDAALQYYVINAAGYDIKDFHVVHVDRDQREQGQTDAERLFRLEPVLTEILERQSFVQSKLDEFKELLSLRRIPDIVMGDHCENPYKCDFTGFCKKQVEKKIGLFSFD